MQLKTGNMLGSVGISMAQWDLEFDEDLFYFEAPPCAPGLTRQNLTASAVAADPCWAGCDFTSSDPDQCGQPFNTSNPTCQAICSGHPKKATLCDFANRPWTVIEPDIESPLFTVNTNEYRYARFNWLRVEQGFRYEGVPIIGQLSLSGVALMDDAAELDGGTYCFERFSPGTYANVCPSFQCFYYGTWEVAIGIINQNIVSSYTGASSHIVRTFPQIEGSVRRTAPRSGAPATYPVQRTPLHTPLQLGVTVDVQFVGTTRAQFFQLTTPYCGLINVQHEKARWHRPIARVAIGVSTDGNPLPTSYVTDIIFIDGAMKPLWICPKQPETNATVFLAVIRYASSAEPALSKPELHYLTVDYYRPEDHWKRFRLGATASESGFSNYTSFPPLTNWAIGLAANLFRVSCPNPLAPSTSKFFDCRAGSAGQGTCLQFLFGVPVDPWTVSLLPVPILIADVNTENFVGIQYPTFQTTAGKRLSAILILELTSEGSVVSQTLGSDWENLWSQCTLHIGAATPVASADGEWFFADLLLNQTVPDCVYSEFEELSQLITAGIESMASDPMSAYSERVLIDELTFHDPWQACTTFISSKLSNEHISQVPVYSSSACLNGSVIDDPCCNIDLSWTQCCAPRDFTASLEVLNLDNETISATCQQASCVEPLLNEYYLAFLADSTGGCSGPNLNSKLRAPIRVYRDCREAAFGNDFELPSCVVDSDCGMLLANTSTAYCNQATKQCVFDFADSKTYFSDNLPIEARIKLIELNGFSSSEVPTLAQQLHGRYGRTTECIDKSFGSPWSQHSASLQTGNQISGCPICSKNITDVSHQPPPWCEVRAASTCTYLFTVQPRTIGCDTQVCNWDQSSDCDTGLLNSSFCGVCESEAICTQVSNVTSESACNKIPAVCFLANGTARTDLTEVECERAFSCTLNCIHGECGSQGECEASGYCETDDEIYEAMAATLWNTVTSTGFCAVPLQPFNNPDCTAVYPKSLPTSYGCIVYGNCSGVTSLLICAPNYYSEELCATLSPDAVWWPRYDEENCLKKTGCNEQLAGIESLSSLGTRLRSPKDEDECSTCDGESESLASWIQGRWLPGTARSPQWIERALATRYKMAESIDFNALYDDIFISSRAAVAFQLQNNIQCSYQTMNTLISKISCACTTNLSREECFSGEFVTSVGQGQACPLTSNTIMAPPGKLSYNGESVDSQLQNQCVEFNIDRINSRFFYGERPPPITTGFVPVFAVRGWNSVVNERDALVGQVIGDGILIHFAQNGQYLIDLRVCLQISSGIPLSENDLFTVYGIGRWKAGSNPATVIPYSNLINVTMDNGSVCGSLQLDRSGHDMSFVPIYYRPDWQDQPSARFSKGQQALLYIVATCYALLCSVIVVQVLRLIGVGALDFNVGTNCMWPLLFFMTVIRSIYFYLVAADTLDQQNSHLLVDFWMMDLPTLLYLISNTVVALSFLFLLLASKNDKYQTKRYFWVTLALMAGFIVAIFVAVLLAFNYAVVDSQGSHGPVLCSTFTENSSSATTIRIVYESLLFAIALLIATITGAIATKLWWSLRSRDGIMSLLILGIVSSFGILSDSLAFLIYYIVNDPTPYFAIVLIFTEILPVTFLVVGVSSKQIKNKKRSTEESSREKDSRGQSYSFNSRETFDPQWT